MIPSTGRFGHLFDLPSSHIVVWKDGQKLYNQYFNHYDPSNTQYSVLKDTAANWIDVKLAELAESVMSQGTLLYKFYTWAKKNMEDLDVLMDLRLLSTLNDYENYDEYPMIEFFLVYKYGPYV